MFNITEGNNGRTEKQKEDIENKQQNSDVNLPYQQLH